MASDKKNDLEKFGLFQEFPYQSDLYKTPGNFEFNASSAKGKQIVIESNKTKSALNHGYFSNFLRTFEGEAYSDPIKIRRELNRPNKEKLAGKVFHLPSIPKNPEGLGSYYGTFSGPIPAMLGETIQFSKSDEIKKRNFYTNCSKKGTGYGYVGLTFNKYPEYKSEPYGILKSSEEKENQNKPFHTVKSLDFFDSNPYKGSLFSEGKEKPVKENLKSFHVNTSHLSNSFNAFPKYENDVYDEKLKRNLPYIKNVMNDSKRTFGAIPGPKTMRTFSILNKNIERSINAQNYGTVGSVFSL